MQNFSLKRTFKDKDIDKKRIKNARILLLIGHKKSD